MSTNRITLAYMYIDRRQTEGNNGKLNYKNVCSGIMECPCLFANNGKTIKKDFWNNPRNFPEKILLTEIRE